MAVPSPLLSSMFSSSTPSPTTPDIFGSLPTVTSDYDEAQQTSSPTGVPGDDDIDPNDADPLTIKSESFIYKYYFLFVILGVVFIIATIFWLRQRRRRRKQIHSHRGRDALARDVERWQQTDPHSQNSQSSSARRWLQRYNRFGIRASGRTGEDEGLNELGEAPPPYKAQEAALEATQRATNTNPSITVPLRTLSRSRLGKPPGYDETMNSPVSSDMSIGEHTASKVTEPSNVSAERSTITRSLSPENATVGNSTHATQRTPSDETR